MPPGMASFDRSKTKEVGRATIGLTPSDLVKVIPHQPCNHLLDVHGWFGLVDDASGMLLWYSEPKGKSVLERIRTLKGQSKGPSLIQETLHSHAGKEVSVVVPL